jgi:hypothetical protein
MRDIEPPKTPAPRVDDEIREHGFTVVPSSDILGLMGGDKGALDALAEHWNALPLDVHLRDGGRYRRRRHGCFVVERGKVDPQPHRAHWQSVEYNALHGGFERWFEPLPVSLVAAEAWTRFLVWLGERADALRGSQPWYVEAHAFRIETTGGIGRPTPEGAHRDGVDLVAVAMLARHAVRGGETRVFEADSARGSRFTLHEPWTTLLLDDARVVHETTPLLPLLPPASSANAAESPPEVGYRDTLVVTLRAGGFQAPR